MSKYVIIGAGVAGISAAEAIRAQDASGDLSIVTDEPAGYYSRPGLAYYLNDEINEQQLYPFAQEDYENLRVDFVVGRVTRIHPVQRQVELQSGVRLAYERLLIATGSSAVYPTVPGIQAQGVVKLDNLTDVRTILQLARKAHTAVVIGGGVTALEIAEGLAARGVKVHYFLRGGRFWSSVLDKTESHIVEKRLVEGGIKIYYQAELAEIYVRDDKVTGVRLSNGRQLACDIVGVAVGVQPCKQLGEAAGLRSNRGLLVDEFLQTSDALIFAAGDVAEVYDPFSKRTTLDSLWGTARQQGKIAGVNMAGRRQVYTKQVSINVTRLADLTTTIIGAVGGGKDEDIIGIAHGDSESWRHNLDSSLTQSGSEVNRLRLMIGSQTLLGAIIMGDQSLSLPLQRMIAGQVDIRPIRWQLLQPGAPVGDILMHFWAQVQNGN